VSAFADARIARRRVASTAALMLVLAAPAIARSEPTCGRTADAHDSRRVWPSPLDRPVTLHVRDVVLRDALDRVAAAASLHLSYSPDGLPLDRGVCVSYDSVAAGEVLSDLLVGTSLSPVSAGEDQVVLAPKPWAAMRHAERDSAPRVNVLDRVVVMGTGLRSGVDGIVGSTDIIDRARLARQPQGQGALSQTLNGTVPGLWLWDQGPSSLTARYGSLRGASSFGGSYPKVYIDGIEVANPALLTTVNPDAVERVQVIRGPEGAALYGADAIGGVIDITMRHDPGGPDGIAQVRGSAGMTHSDFAQRPVLVQEHAVDLRGGNDERSSALSLVVGSIGSYVPGARSWDAGADAGFRLLGARTMLTGTARLYAKDAGVGVSPFVGPSASGVGAGSASVMNGDRLHGEEPRENASRADWTTSPVVSSQSVREYTLGTTAVFSPDGRWTHALTVGLDGYTLSGGTRSEFAPTPSAVDSALLATPGSGTRATVRASSVARLTSNQASAVVTLAAEHSTLWEGGSDADQDSPLGSRYEAEPALQSNTGIFGQLEGSFRDALFATGGLRVEHYAGLTASDGLVSLPMLGGAVVHSFGAMTAKLRASYGKAARSPGAAVRASWLEHEPAVAGRLVPEEQSGLEGGIDLFVGSAAALRVTRFDQHAYSLIQPVAIASSVISPAAPAPTRLLYALQNVGEIGNRGWELESSAAAGRLSITGTLSLVDSRVRRLSATYTGDLHPGDRMLAVPARSGGLSSAWTSATWSASLTATRVSDWVNYDAVALAKASGTTAAPIVGTDLRGFWRLYPAVTRLDASASRDVFHRFTLVFTARNLLDVQRGEPDNLTVVPGRTLSGGVKATF
jgi:iron complex outermembrane recepter protein